MNTKKSETSSLPNPNSVPLPNETEIIGKMVAEFCKTYDNGRWNEAQLKRVNKGMQAALNVIRTMCIYTPPHSFKVEQSSLREKLAEKLTNELRFNESVDTHIDHISYNGCVGIGAILADAALAVVREWMVSDETIYAACDAYAQQEDSADLLAMKAALQAAAKKMGEE